MVHESQGPMISISPTRPAIGPVPERWKSGAHSTVVFAPAPPLIVSLSLMLRSGEYGLLTLKASETFEYLTVNAL